MKLLTKQYWILFDKGGKRIDDNKEIGSPDVEKK